MTVEIVEVDPFDDAEFAAYWAAGREADQHERPYATYWPLRTAEVAFRGTDPTWVLVAFAARVDAETVGQSQLLLPQMDNRHLAYSSPLVRPGHRGRGIGTALLGTVVERCRAEGRTTLLIEATRPVDGPDSPGWRFLLGHGFTPGITDVHRILPLPVDTGRLAELADTAAPRHAEYTLVSCSDGIPAEYVDGFCALQEAFVSEAPMGELDIEPEVWTPERLRANEERRAKQRTWSETTFAVASDGSLAGMTELTVTGDGEGNCMQGATLVLRAHRGHRLGMALKVANLRSLQARGPMVPMVHSWNAEENDHMAAINVELGFRPVEEVAEMQRRLDGSPES